MRLVRLRQEHIELLRTWRNAEKIARFMEYRQHITPQMQQQWFDRLSPIADFYFMIEYRGEMVGMIHASGINWLEGRGDAGLFIFEDRYLSTYIPVLASLCLLDLFFGVFGLQRLYAKVMRNNPVATEYNKRLGFKALPDQAAHDFQLYKLERADYLATTESLRAHATTVEGNGFDIALDSATESMLRSVGAFTERQDFDFNLNIV